MSNSRYGFTADHIASPSFTAAVAAWHDPAKKMEHRTDYNLATFGCVYAGQGQEGEISGSGRANFPIPMIGQGINALVKLLPAGMVAHIHVHEDFCKYVGTGGYVRAAMRNKGRTSSGKPMHGYDVLRESVETLDAGRWLLCGSTRPFKFAPLRVASELASGPAKFEGRKHKAANEPSFSNPDAGRCISFDEPAPYSIMVQST